MKKLFLFFMLVFTFSTTAKAHEFILKPYFFTQPLGLINPFQVISAHTYMLSEEMEPLDKVKVELRFQDKRQTLSLIPNKTLFTLDGSFEPEKEGTYLLLGHREGMIWTKTKQGWKQESKKNLKNVIASGKYEKFAKAIIQVGKPNPKDNSFKQKTNQTLEIIPLVNPYFLKPGDILPVKILYKNKPINLEVKATYDRFSLYPNSYAYLTEAQEDGLAHIKITAPGIWMVRVETKEEVNSPDFDQHVLRSVLTFEVR